MEDYLIERFPDKEAYSGAEQNRCAVSVSVIKLNCGRRGVTIELCTTCICFSVFLADVKDINIVGDQVFAYSLNCVFMLMNLMLACIQWFTCIPLSLCPEKFMLFSAINVQYLLSEEDPAQCTTIQNRGNR